MYITTVLPLFSFCAVLKIIRSAISSYRRQDGHQVSRYGKDRKPFTITMKLSIVSLLTLWGLASAAPTKRSPASIESAISSISGNLGTLDRDINSFTGSFFEALGLLADFNNLQSSISSATSEVTSTGALGDSDSATIYDSLSSLASQVAGTLSDTEAKVSRPQLKCRVRATLN